MLEGVKPERGDSGGVGMAENAEHAAFFAQAIGVQVEIRPNFRLVRIGLARGIHNRLLRLSRSGRAASQSVPERNLTSAAPLMKKRRRRHKFYIVQLARFVDPARDNLLSHPQHYFCF